MFSSHFNGIALILTGVLGFASHGISQELKILRDTDGEPALAKGDFLQYPAGDISSVMKSSRAVRSDKAPNAVKPEKVQKAAELGAGSGKEVKVQQTAGQEEAAAGQLGPDGNDPTGKTEAQIEPKDPKEKKSGDQEDQSLSAKIPFTLGVIDGESDKASTVVTIRLNQKADWKEVAMENHNTYLQIPLPRTLVPESGKFIDIKSPYITKAAALQVTPDRGAVRLYLTREFGAIESALHADILGDRIVVTVDHDALEKIGIFDHIQKAGIKGTPSVAEVVAKTQVRSDIPDPITGIKQDKEAGQEDSLMSANLSQKTRLVAIFSALIFVGFIGLTFMRSLLLRLRTPSRQESEFVMKTIASSCLAPKHKLTLMQIGEERILLSVSPDGIRYLTTIGTSERAAAYPLPRASGNLDGVRYHENVPRKPLLAGAGAPYRGVDNKGIGVTTKEANQVRRPAPRKEADDSQLTLDGRSAIGHRLQTVISDEGVQDLRKPYRDNKAAEASPAHANKAIEDVTTLIRKKIKNLPTF